MEENKELETVTESQRNAGKGLFLSGIIVGFAATLLVVGGIFIAFQIHRIVTVKDDVSAQVSYDEGSAVNAQTIKKLQLLEDTVKENFYLSEVTNEQLEDGMYRGLMEALDDPYSEYYTAEELNELTEQTQGIYYGIGAYVSMDSDTNLPKISGVIEGAPAADLDQYDTVFVGFPIWWYVEPRIVDTFLERYDFSGKTVIPFATSGGSGIEKAERSLKSHCPQANWKKGKLLNHMDVAAWTKSVLDSGC